MALRYTVSFKIRAIATVGILGFSIYFFINIYLGQINQKLLASLSAEEVVSIDEISRLEADVHRHKTLLADAVDFEDINILLESNAVAVEIVSSYQFISDSFPSMRSDLEKVSEQFQSYDKYASDYVELVLNQDVEDLLKDIALKNMSDSNVLHNKTYKKIREQIYASFNNKISKLSEQSRLEARFGYIIGILLLAFISVMAFFISRSVTGSIQAAVTVSDKIARGDLSDHGYIAADDETGLLLASLDTMRRSIKDTQKGLVITANFADSMSGGNLKQALSNANAALRELFNLPCTALFVLSGESKIKCLSISSLDPKQLNAELFDRLGIPVDCFERQHKTCLRVEKLTENIHFDFLIGNADLMEINSYPIFFDNSCIGVITTTHIVELQEQEVLLVQQCIDRLAIKVNAYQIDQERHALIDSLDERANELERLNEENIQMNAAKSEFLACMSHEIRTPMNGVLGMLGLIMRSDLSKKQRHYATLANDSANSLLLLINDILDFTKIGAGKLELELLDFDLRRTLGSFAESMAQRAQGKGIELILDLTEIDHSMVRADPGRIRQVLVNLVGNAVKFTSTGEIVIRASLKETVDDELLFVCSVSDTGIGIPQEKIASMFESFTQVDSSTTRQFGGTGLGLAIVKQLCELMDGKIDVSSEIHKGSNFEVSLRLYSSARSSTVEPSESIKNKRILVVDDNATNCEALCAQLTHWGACVLTSGDGVSALALLEEELQERGQLFDLALLDMQMPDMDGAELAKNIRQDFRFDQMKMVMMTSMDEEAEANYFTDLGFSAHFRKPATTSDLFEALKVLDDDGLEDESQVLIGDRKPQVIHPSFSRDTRILLVEDNPINQEVALGVLEDFGLSADVAGNGLEAITSLEFSPATAPYELVLMDCQMPEMDGYEATRQIRAGKTGKRNQKIPIIAMTANAMKGDRERCLDAGMSDYVTKPIDSAVLERKLELWLNGKVDGVPAEAENFAAENSIEDVVEASAYGAEEGESADGAAEEESAEGAAEKESAEGVAEQESADGAGKQEGVNLPVWDKEDFLRRIRGKKTRLVTYTEMFLADMPERVTKFKLAVDNDEFSSVERIAHGIVGSAANLSGRRLEEFTRLMEFAARDERSQQLHDFWPTFEGELKMLTSAFEKELAEIRHS